MRIIFSRKGFDSAAGGAASPIICGEPISLPIPTMRRSESTYGLLGLGDVVSQVTKGRLGADSLCHEDPMFYEGRCAFGQTGAAQSHLAKQGVCVGDTFLFFGLFAYEGRRDRHHRIFGYLQVEEVRAIGTRSNKLDGPQGFPRRHPHIIDEWNDNNSIYLGRGAKAKFAHPNLRLSRPEGPVSYWLVPPWLRGIGLSYHGSQDRWTSPKELRVVGRGQEFVADVCDQEEPHAWLTKVIETVESPVSST
jgi:hypothetical protein